MIEIFFYNKKHIEKTCIFIFFIEKNYIIYSKDLQQSTR
jgi:hypothetical protein